MHSDMSETVGPEQREAEVADDSGPTEFLQGDARGSSSATRSFTTSATAKFEEISDRVGVENYWPWGPSVGDLNADGWQDVFIASSMNFPFRYGINSLLLNNRGEKFLDSEFLARRRAAPRRPDAHAVVRGRLLDAARAWPHPTGLCKGRTGKITVMAPLGSRSSVIFDLDDDGDLDIVTNDFNSEPQVLVSDLAQRQAIHWLGVALVGTTSNRNGLGATVRVSAGGRVLTQWNDGKSGYLSQSVLPLYFGLGDVDDGRSRRGRLAVRTQAGDHRPVSRPTPRCVSPSPHGPSSRVCLSATICSGAP